MSDAPTQTPADPIQAPGTSEKVWRNWSALQELPPCPLQGIESILVLAAHPDDDILGLGGTLARLGAAGVRVRVLVATDGESSHPGSPTVSPENLAAQRRQEHASSLKLLGLGAPTRLGLPDGGLAACEEQLAEAIGRQAPDFDLCIAPWTADVHPDHECVGRAATRAGAAAGIPVWHFPVWMWHWAEPSDTRVPWDRARRIELPGWALDAKNTAIACHASQILPLSPAPQDAAILPESDLAHFRRDFEVVFV